MHRKLPSFSLNSNPPSSSPPETPKDSRLSRSKSPARGGLFSRTRSLSPFSASRRKNAAGTSGLKTSGKPNSPESSDNESTVFGGVSGDEGSTSDEESEMGERKVGDGIEGDGSSSEGDEDEMGLDDTLLCRNTEANANPQTPLEYLSSIYTPQSDAALLSSLPPNLHPPSALFPPTTFRDPAAVPKRKNTKPPLPILELKAGRPVFERNRCTITVDHGDPIGVGKTKKRTRKYLVASDLSDESLYAIEWTIGTVLRDGDQCILVSVMETETKLDPQDNSGDKMEKIRNQKERQEKALILSREATALVERTRLNVRIRCQAIHAKNARHMLIDMIDYEEPTMVIVGSRGLDKIKGMLLGSVSNYLIQKSSVPVMVARRRLKKVVKVHKPKSALNRDPRVASLDQAAIEKMSNAAPVHTSEDLREKEEE